ncbi:AAA family ATPase (plasmid) [Halorarum halophilum]|uniref:AAA family ATPase n=1 Tax=Halorarum halophilum TaxID=2743090 RepID=A0A7D5KP65_9EURY|nr:archaea-specific SMC-related protein [Halobaculum halophilum]QLG29935.1 AAA family ATPase [Halobaculum halophilum]
MRTEEITKGEVTICARNIGGISETEVVFEPGVTILAGRNATNRTSLLQAIMLGLGSDRASLKGDADEGEVELRVDGEQYTRTLTRRNGGVALGGDPYLDDPEVADLFAFLLEGNEARRAVAWGEDLRELIMRPIDTGAIRAEIDHLETERRDLDERLDSLEEVERRLPELESRRTNLEADIEEKRQELESAESEVESLDESVKESREERDELEAKLDELRETRSELDRLRRRIETEEGSIESLTEEQSEVESELDSMPEETDADTGEIEREIDRLRERKRTLDGVVGELQNVVQFNEEILEGDRSDVRSALNVADDGAVTDRLVEDQTVCWTCGSEVQKEQIESTQDRLREFRKSKLESIRTTEDRLSELRGDLQSAKSQRERRADLDSRLDRIDDELDSRRSRRDELRSERKSVSEELETLEAEVDELENEEFSDTLDKHKEANEIEFEIGRLENDLNEVVDEIEELESKLDEREELEAEREEVKEALVDSRTRIEQIETQAVEEFNTHIETVLDILEYGNLDRVWIERVERQVREGRRKVDRSVFELHIVRTNESGTTYEDTIDHLSESEREVTGLVFALAGYLVHEVYQTLPFIVLDSLEAIDSERIAKLVEYFSDYAAYSVVALLPEDEQALDDAYRRVSDI